jgi:hypothetical protein
MTIEELIREYKTGYRFKKETGLSHTCWHNWKERGYIPIHSQIVIQRLSNGRLKADINHIPEVR